MQTKTKQSIKNPALAGLIGIIVTLIAAWFGVPLPLPTPTTPPTPTEIPSVAVAGRSSDYEYYEGRLHAVSRVVDGDTIYLLTPDGDSPITKVRLLGVDTPETVHPNKPVEPYGPEATNHTRSLVDSRNVSLTLSRQQPTRDRYGRLLAFVALADGTDVSASLLAVGLGRTTPQYPQERTADYKIIADQARVAGLGIWSNAGN